MVSRQAANRGYLPPALITYRFSFVFHPVRGTASGYLHFLYIIIIYKK